ncbi:hypothetical protein [Halegenticoccus tardaugens]|uniref:hypothetical protein n=1 Tax=Halegenticoccus tardaugens TaxID=2071624 RepID=UPI00100AAEE1|nr:hypothetical protein [Halegenticoccus tardaugens]
MYPETGEHPTLPTLQDGMTLLRVGRGATGALHSLVLDRLLVQDGDAAWVDANGHGSTQQLCRLAPTMRPLDRVHIARGFTPWQHYSLLADLPEQVSDGTSIVVLPAFDRFYRTDDLRRGEGERLLSEAVARVDELLDETAVPVLVTLSELDEFARPVVDAVSETLTCDVTRYGPRFSGESFETLVYPVDDGAVQTTISYWNRVLAARHPTVAAAGSPTEVIAGGAN